MRSRCMYQTRQASTKYLQCRPNLRHLVIEVDPVLPLVKRTRTTMIVAAHPADTALDVTDTVIGAHLDEAIMTMSAVAMVVPLREAAPRLTTILRPVVAALMILIAGTTLLQTHMPMAGPRTTDLLQGITLREMPVTPNMIAAAATGNLSCLKPPPVLPNLH